jgi:DNA-binding MarR family transcriptional regulator
MSNPAASRSNATKDASAPMIGALLRLPHEVVMGRLLEAVHRSGFDLTPTELGVFLYPGPDGRRPIELARQCGMSRQAMNYVLAGLERRGYVERHAARGGGPRTVRLTARGRKLIAPLRPCVAEIEREWAAQLGTRRFAALRETLFELSKQLGKLD